MTDAETQDAFRRIQAIKSRFPGHSAYGYSHGAGEKVRGTNIAKNEFLSCLRQKRATEWQPVCLSEHPRPFEITCYAIHHKHVGHIPNYGGHIPGAKFRYGATYGHDTIDAKRWFRGEN
ncbi:hypothetical protein RUM44_013388 [Polyplax serrata]|uniref:Ciliary microtubule inner protein 2A-C-like domain-containing protein n=1 Tax=Polyplax serrata TaxID=468196 RepID=A0ABR1BE17_POLSC